MNKKKEKPPRSNGECKKTMYILTLSDVRFSFFVVVCGYLYHTTPTMSLKHAFYVFNVFYWFHWFPKSQIWSCTHRKIQLYNRLFNLSTHGEWNDRRIAFRWCWGALTLQECYRQTLFRVLVGPPRILYQVWIWCTFWGHVDTFLFFVKCLFASSWAVVVLWQHALGPLSLDSTAGAWAQGSCLSCKNIMAGSFFQCQDKRFHTKTLHWSMVIFFFQQGSSQKRSACWLVCILSMVLRAQTMYFHIYYVFSVDSCSIIRTDVILLCIIFPPLLYILVLFVLHFYFFFYHIPPFSLLWYCWVLWASLKTDMFVYVS